MILKKWMCIQTKLNEPLQTGRGGGLLSSDAPGDAKEELTNILNKSRRGLVAKALDSHATGCGFKSCPAQDKDYRWDYRWGR